ncbi:parallel beta-helix repeat protein [Methanococcus maripaludis]|uniref:Parallel beta-helix repeat protein n=1 Tax=Methanococcus maripaludis TaxID=39152 RepID=A0A7J9NMM6_METMI|nr:NosD domain-containing protein [Methanococcus maripaludis]MBA2846290.1 parallel beta-helix repeat protein [Methanococcus maripaludis]
MNELKFKTAILLALLTCLACISSVSSADTAINTNCVITEPGNYYLTDNITGTTANVIEITCSNVVLDGQGYFIDGANAAGSGIYAGGVSNITIKNVNIRNFSGGSEIYFSEVTNSFITNNSLESDGLSFGIQLESYSNNNTITGNTANSNSDGIFLTSSSNYNLITNNTANSNANHGILLVSSLNNTITGNTADLNDKYGIYLYSSLNNTITGNTADSNNLTGIYLQSSSNYNTITGNTADSNNDSGISLQSSLNNTITSNAVNLNNNSGIFLTSSLNNLITNNTADSNNNSGIYLQSSSNYNTITNNTANSNANFGIFLTSSSNNTITNNGLNSNAGGSGIYLGSSSNYNTITGNNATSNVNGISLKFSLNNTIIGNTIDLNSNSGISLTYSSNYNTITGNNATSNSNGIYLKSSSNTITNNTADSNSIGIYLDSSLNNTITGNNATSNSGDGIYLCSSSNYNTITNNTADSNVIGISLTSSSNNSITNNTADLNGIYGIYLGSSSNNAITTNAVNSNVLYGISLVDSNYNQIYTNIFNNSQNYDISSSGINYWNTSKEQGGGNYWFTPTGMGWSETHSDLNNDGFCDDQYNLSTDNIDYLPKSLDMAAPEVIINSPLNESIYNTSSILINVTAIDSSDVSLVTVEIENVKNVTLSLNGSYYTGNTGNLLDGIYNITVTSKDENGNTNTTKPVTITIDTTAPKVIINHAEDDFNRITNILNVTINDLSLDSVIAEINNGTVLKNITLNETNGYFGNSTYEFSEGLNTVKIYANDSFGHRNSNETVDFVVDLTKPVITVNIEDGKYFNNGSNVINFTVDEDYIDSVTAFNGSTEILLNNSTGNYLNSVALNEGVYNVTIRINDTAGNNVNKTVRFTVDTTAPVLTLKNPVNGTTFTTSSISLNVSANDSLSNVSSVIAKIGSVRNVTLFFDGEYYTGNTGTLSNGNYEIRIIVTDLAGNVNSNETVNITVAVPSSSSRSSGSSHSSSSDVSDDIESDSVRDAVSDSDVVYGNSFDEGYAQELKENLYDSEDYEISGDTIIVGGPESNKLAEKYDSKFGISISNDNPGENKGIIQVLKVQDNSGSIIQSYTIIYIAGSDRLGTQAALEYFKTLNELPEGPLMIEWTANGPVLA